MAAPRVIQQFIRETRRLTPRNISEDITATHNQVIIAEGQSLINLPEPIDGTEVFMKARTNDDVHLIAPPQANVDGEGQLVSQNEFQSVRLAAGDDTWYIVSQKGDQFITLDRPSYTLTNFSAPTQAEYGTDITGSVDILNEGDLGNEPMSLTLGQSELAEEFVRLDFNETVNLSLTGTIQVLPGSYSLTIQSRDGSISQNFEVTTPTTFIEILNFDAPVNATDGEVVDVSATVKNQGQNATDVPIELYIDRNDPTEQLVSSATIDLNFLEERTLDLSFTLDTNESTVSLELVTPDDTISQDVTVN